MDALAEVYTSWMRDVRLGKSRLMIAKSLLNNVGTGQGSAFNAEQEAYASMNMLGGQDSKLSDMIEQVQFNIRVQEHQETAIQLVKDILQMAGYSSETFGIYDGGGPTKTATEIEVKQQRSLLSRDRKIRLWRPAITEAIRKLLAVDQALFGSPVVPQDVSVLFADGVQDSPLEIANTVSLLRAAGAASDEVIVGMVHQDWDETQVAAEVALIQAQKKADMPAPMLDPFTHQGAVTDVPNGSDPAAHTAAAGEPTGNG
jgi:A118 family predicted phage portal protein